MSLADLVAAGAPELPDGCFYRVRAGYIVDFVEIRRRRRIGSAQVAAVRIRTEAFFSPSDAVVDACQRVCMLVDELVEEARFDAELRTLYGDHDPRRTK